MDLYIGIVDVEDTVQHDEIMCSTRSGIRYRNGTEAEPEILYELVCFQAARCIP